MHGEVINNIRQAQIKHKCAYATRKENQMFMGFKEGVMLTKMKKFAKKKSLDFSYEGPFLLCSIWMQKDFWKKMKVKQFV